MSVGERYRSASVAGSWTSRKQQAAEQDAALRQRLGSEEEELAVLAARPEEIAEQRNALMDQLQAADFADHIRLYQFAGSLDWNGVAGTVQPAPVQTR